MPEPTSLALMGVGSAGLVVCFFQQQYDRAKTCLDFVLGFVLLVVMAPVIGVCALLVKLTSRGPTFYCQRRLGLHGKPFTLIKLRTMYEDAERKTGPVWARGKRDPRVTPVGAVLRTTHLDELPQLINVLRGQMSLIGPRPERPHFVSKFREVIPEYDKRMSVKPGITGLAQVRAGYDHNLRDVKRKVKLDLVYIRRMCWWVDLLIAARTLKKFLEEPDGEAGPMPDSETGS